MKLFCFPGVKPDRADSGGSRLLGRVNEETTNATNELSNEKTISANEYGSKRRDQETASDTKCSWTATEPQTQARKEGLVQTRKAESRRLGGEHFW